jgi:hypothetical protein
MIGKGFGREHSWPNQGTTLVFAWRELRKTTKISLRIACILAKT